MIPSITRLTSTLLLEIPTVTGQDGEDVRRSGDYSETGSDVEHPAGNSYCTVITSRREGVSGDKSLYTASAP